MKRILLTTLMSLAWIWAYAQCPPTSPLSTPYTEDFDSQAASQTGTFANCWVANTTSDPNWETEDFTTPSSSTGPNDDVSGGGVYAYMETSGGSNGDTASLTTPGISLTGLTNPELTFYYHMYGATIGELEVLIWNGSSWTKVDSIVGQQQTASTDAWRLRIVSLSGYTGTIQVKFRGSKGSSFTGDMAIDEVSVAEAITCPQPMNLVAKNIGPFNATLDWDAVTQATSGYTIIYGQSGFDPSFAGTTTSSTTDSIALTGLAGATDYDAYIISDCGATNGISDTAGPLAFTTSCVAYTAPYSRDFDSDAQDAPPLCWNDYETYSGAYVEVEDFRPAFSGTQALYLYNSFSSSSDDLYAITPQFTDATNGDKQLRFQMSVSDVISGLYIGSVSHPDTPSTFVAIDTVILSASNTYTEIIVPLTTANGYNGTHEYFVLAHTNGGTFDYIYVDDFNYEVIPPCPKATALTAVNATDSSFTLSYDNGGDTVDVEWGPAGFTQGTGCLASGVVATGKQFTIDNNTASSCTAGSQLMACGVYDVYVRNNCTASGNGSSVWSGPIQVVLDPSDPAIAATLPFLEDFETYTGTYIDRHSICASDYSIKYSTTGVAGGRLRFDAGSTFALSGSRSATFDRSSYDFNGTANFMDFTLDMSNYVGATNIQLTFEWMHHGESDNANDRVWVRGSKDSSWLVAFDFSGIRNFSNDGVMFSEGPIDIDSVLSANNQVFTATFQMRFGQEDRSSAFTVNFSDGMTYDDILLRAPSCNDPTNFALTAGSVTQTAAQVTWASTDSNHIVEYGLAGYTAGTGTQIAKTDTFHTFSGLTPGTKYDVYVKDSCGLGNTSFWVGPVSFTTLCNPFAAPFREDFDGSSWVASGSNSGNALDACWSSDPNTSSSEVFKWVPRSTAPSSRNGPTTDITGGNFLYAEASGSSSGDRAELVSPPIDLSALLRPALYFGEHRYYSSFGSIHDMEVDVTNDDGATWTTLHTSTGQTQSSATAPWDTVFVNLAAYLNDTVQIRFTQIGVGCCGDVGLDLVEVKEGPSCPDASNLGVTALRDTAATLTWSDPSATSHEIWIGATGFYQGTTTVGGYKDTTSAGSFRVDTLTDQTCYDFLVRGICGPGDTSKWVGPFTFCTPCSPKVAPYTEDWDAVATRTTGDFGNCWEGFSTGTSSFSNYNFQTESGTTGSGSTGPSGDASSTGSGVYVYTEASFGRSGDTATLLSPLVDVSGLTTPELRFNFHFYGSNIDTMFIDIYDGTSWTPAVAKIRGQQQTSSNDPWRIMYIDLGPYSASGVVQARWRMKSNGCCTGDAALDNMIFDEAVTCPAPSSPMVLSTDSLSATIAWDAGVNTANSFEVEYGTTGILGDTSHTRTVVSNDTNTITGLMDGTNYCYWVRDICGPGDTSIWVGPICFLTDCKSKSATYIMNADNQNDGTPLCWTAYERGSSSSFWAFDVDPGSFYAANSAPNHIRFYIYNADTLFAISPLFNDIAAGDKRLRFQARATSTFGTNDLVVGTMSDPSDGATFNPLDTFAGVTTTYNEYVTELTTANGYNGTDQYVVISHEGSTFRTMYLDDIRYEVIPTCIRPDTLGASSITQTTADLHWTTGGSSSIGRYEVEYGSNPFGNANNTRQVVNNDTLSLTTLTAGTPYCYWVREICTVGDTSFWSGPYCFSTPCPTSFSTPYFTNFEGIKEGTFTTFDNCWTTPTTSGVPRWEAEESTGSNQNSFNTGPIYDQTQYGVPGGIYMFTENSGARNGATVDLESPTIDLSNLNVPEIRFWYFMYGATVNRLEVLVDSGNGYVVVDSIVGQQQASQSEPWRERRIALAGYSGTINVAFRHYAGSSFTSDLAIDDFSVQEAPTCPAPMGLSSTAASSTSANVTWTGDTNSTYFEVQYGAPGFMLGTGTTDTTSADSIALNFATANNLCRDVYVRGVCGAGDTSLWTGPISACPTPITCVDSIEQYDVSDIVGQSALFLGWYGGNGDGATVSTAQAASGTKSIYIPNGGRADIVAAFDTLNTGAYSFKWEMYVPTGTGAYYNIQRNYSYGVSGVTNVWAFDVNFSKGAGTVDGGSYGGTQVDTFSYPQGQWFTMENIIDFDNDTAYLQINGTPVGNGWKYSFGNMSVPIQANAVNFYSNTLADPSPDFYFDDVCIAPVVTCPAPTGVRATGNVGCDSVEVGFTSNTGGSVVEYGPTGFAPGTGTFLAGIQTTPVIITGLTPGTAYDVMVADTCGADTSAYAMTTVTTASGPLPVASISANDISGGGDFSIVEFDASGSTNADTYSWDFGNGTNSTGAIDTANYSANGSYTITLIVSNACGSDTATQAINVNVGLVENALGRSLQVFPNPASDAVNVSFKEVGSADVSIRMTDAQGRAVMEISDKLQSGTYRRTINTSELAAGVYMLIIESGDMTAMRRISIRQ